MLDVGGLVGANELEGKIITSHATGGVSGQGDNFGGLAGVNLGAITDSYATGGVSGIGFADVGGLVGDNRNTGVITAAYAEGSVSGQGDNFGGLAGGNSGAITDSYATGGVSGIGFADVGGLVGDNRNTGVITAAYAEGSVSGQGDNFGGLAGGNSGVITDSYATGSVSGIGYADVGGLVGDNRNTGVITAAYAEGSVSGRGDNRGGLAGGNSGVITDSYATGSVSGRGGSVGGLVGGNRNTGVITAAYAEGSLSGRADRFGGLAGGNSGVIAASYATGSVLSDRGGSVGGLVGQNYHTGVITAAYAEGSVSGRADRFGGLLGSNLGVVTFCFSTGEVRQSGGGLIERNGNYANVANCYWDTETSDHSDSAGGEGKTTAELQSPTGYTGPYADWNVDLDGDGSRDDPWSFGSATDYPVLNLGTLDIAHGNLNARPPTRTQVERGIVQGGKLRKG